jgi:cell wall-associated NlpC family hydrolase
MRMAILALILLLAGSCNLYERRHTSDVVVDSVKSETVHTAFKPDSMPADQTKVNDTLLPAPKGVIDTRHVLPDSLIAFAKTLIGTPYQYGSTNPKVGFDCSGFITYVFNHFSIPVPRSSIDFTNVGKDVPVADAKPGDLILFTGTDSTERHVGHMGIVLDNQNNQLQFIHSTSGKKYGVTITPFNDYYHSRFVKVIRVFPQNNMQ